MPTNLYMHKKYSYKPVSSSKRAFFIHLLTKIIKTLLQIKSKLNLFQIVVNYYGSSVVIGQEFGIIVGM